MKTPLLLTLFVLVFVFAATFMLGTPATHGIRFAWTNPTGYTIGANTLYCGTATHVYTVNWVLPPSQAFDWTTTDTQHTGVAGTKYFCAVTDTVAGIESGYSNEVSATFPEVPTAPASVNATAY